MKKTLKTYSKKFEQFTVKLTTETREESNASNIKVWITLGDNLVSMSSASSVYGITEETALKRMEDEWKEFTRHDNNLDYLNMNLVEKKINL